MPRNDQVTCQWHLLRQLESPGGVTLRQLADRLPADYPKHLRTLRRDLAALAAADFPLITERVDGHTRWKLLEGYRRVPTLTFLERGSNPVPYGTEMPATRDQYGYQYGFALTLRGSKSSPPGGPGPRSKHLCSLGEVVGNHGRFLFDCGAESIVLQLTEEAAPRILYAFEGGRAGRSWPGRPSF